MKEYKSKVIYILLPLIIATSFIIGMISSIWMSDGIVSKSLFIPSDKDKLSLVIDYILNEYVDQLDRNDIIEKAIPELLKSLDPHSVYIDAITAKEMLEELEGEFDGIGVQFNILRDTIYIINTIPDGPSEKKGVSAGDRIIKINDTIVAGTGIKNADVMKMLKGLRGTTVNIEVLRRGVKDLIVFQIERGHIPLRSVDATYLISEKIGYIKISSFSRTTHTQFVESIFKLKSNYGIESLILDLRDNAGGYMNAATNIVDEFLPGSKLLVYTEGKARPRKIITSTDKRSICQDINVVVLIDEFSASAAEIVAGAIQDNDRGIIIGRRSFGKGLVQEAVNFIDGSMMRLTTARYYTPSGRSIQKAYEDGTEEYHYDVLRRYEHGEFMEADSIKFNDSLIHYTNSGRIVYGGGGIMPDIFIPVDTSGYSELFGLIRSLSYDYLFSVDYVDFNREKLKEISTTSQLIKYLDKINLMSEFYKYIEAKNLKINPKQILISEKIIKNAVYAYIARQILGDDAFYEIYNQDNSTIDKAIEILDKGISVFDL